MGFDVALGSVTMTEQARVQSDTRQGVSRRQFLASVWLALGALAAGEAAYLGLRYIGSRHTPGVFGGVVSAGSADEFAPGTITRFDKGRFFLIRFDDGGFLALHNRCTHLACVVSWEEDGREFRCPCHGSAFATDGTGITPPAPRALDRFPVLRENGVVKVDTHRRLQQSDGQHIDLVYVTEGAG